MKTPNRKTLPLALVFAMLTLSSSVMQMARAASWFTNSPMNTPRDTHTATVLTNGKVLVVGGRNNGVSPVLTNAELYDPVTQLFTNTASLAVARESHTATLLPNGKVLVAGGVATGGVITNSAELYDAATGAWTPTGFMKTRRLGHTATLLPNGKVLVAAGLAAIGGLVILTNSAELYDPASGTWTFTNSMSTKRYNHTATLLADGRVLVAGGDNGVNSLASAELYNPTNGNWTPVGSPMFSPRFSHTATLLPNGKVLFAGGFGASGITNTAELFNPTDETWASTVNTMSTARRLHTATLLPNGRVLVTGGGNGTNGALVGAELYDPATATWTATGSLNTGRNRHTATALSAKVLVAGGNASNGPSLSSTELFDSTVGFTSILQTSNGPVEMTLSGNNDSAYLIEASTNLNHWKLIACLNASSSPVRFLDPELGQFDQRFYRYHTFPTSAQTRFNFPDADIVLGLPRLFQHPSYSSSTANFIDTTPGHNFTRVTNSFPSGGPATNVLHVSWAFTNGAVNPWLRLTTFNASRYPNPILDFSQGFGFDIHADRDLYVVLGLRETDAVGSIGTDGGTTGPIEWVGGTVNNSVSPPRGRLITAGQWHRVCFWVPDEPMRAFTGDGVLTSTTGKGVLEHLALVPVNYVSGVTNNVYLGNFQTVQRLP